MDIPECCFCAFPSAMFVQAQGLGLVDLLEEIGTSQGGDAMRVKASTLAAELRALFLRK
jgi:hypothetical protein